MAHKRKGREAKEARQATAHVRQGQPRSEKAKLHWAKEGLSK